MNQSQPMLSNKEKLLELIEDCIFLSKETRSQWQKNVEKLPESFYPLLFGKFHELKKTMDSQYIKIELARDENGKYKGEIDKKMQDALSLLNSQQSENISKELI